MEKIFIFTHTDDDGKCAGAIVNSEFTNLRPTYFGKYNYSHNFKDISFPYEEDYDENSIFYFVDLSIDDVIFECMTRCVAKGCKVIHIDHHKTTFDFIDNMTEEQHTIYDKVQSFRKLGISGCLLTWIYACMNPDEREHRMDIEFDMTEGRTHLMLPNNREYSIPMIIRYIDDNDVWRHYYDETKYFNMGFQLESDKRPHNKELWDNLIYGNGIGIRKYIDNGMLLYKYQSIQNQSLAIRNAFVYDFETSDGQTIKCLCLNSILGNSRVFGSDFDKFPFVIKFGFDNTSWRYAIYSHENSDIDVSVIAKQYGGGGHKHASGFVTDDLIFDKNKISEYIPDENSNWD